ncbi:unnamed protein product [Prunus armeniaca]|uniref:Uncharacterized protein n=1 Tax=Prunus armeniaca TaxID=36596 RepID=A0A6J5WJQ6_PRUAR|nr:unnamed protein product [Prunus armeniaca]
MVPELNNLVGLKNQKRASVVKWGCMVPRRSTEAGAVMDFKAGLLENRIKSQPTGCEIQSGPVGMNTAVHNKNSSKSGRAKHLESSDDIDADGDDDWPRISQLLSRYSDSRYFKKKDHTLHMLLLH